jgi:hypothetical protein
LFLGRIGYEAAGFGFQVGTKGCLAATKIFPSVAKSTDSDMAGGFNFKGLSDIDFGWMPIGFYSTLPQQQDRYRLRSTPISPRFRESSRAFSR